MKKEESLAGANLFVKNTIISEYISFCSSIGNYPIEIPQNATPVRWAFFERLFAAYTDDKGKLKTDIFAITKANESKKIEQNVELFITHVQALFTTKKYKRISKIVSELCKIRKTELKNQERKYDLLKQCGEKLENELYSSGLLKRIYERIKMLESDFKNDPILEEKNLKNLEKVVGASKTISFIEMHLQENIMQ